MSDQGKPQGSMKTAPVQLETIKVVGIGSNELDPEDKKVLCKAICYCHYNPKKGKNDQNLYQQCVSGRLAELDKFLGHQSPWKPEISYDMHKNPPEPIMDKGILTKAHDSVIGWIKKYWEGDKGYPYEPKQGMIRRPDVVIVNDPTKPPTQDNIKNVVEIKFGDDEFGTDQREAYTLIAGSKSKVKVLDPDECNCGSDDESDGKTVEEFSIATVAAAVGAAILFLGTRGKTPPPRFPVPAW